MYVSVSDYTCSGWSLGKVADNTWDFEYPLPHCVGSATVCVYIHG